MYTHARNGVRKRGGDMPVDIYNILYACAYVICDAHVSMVTRSCRLCYLTVVANRISSLFGTGGLQARWPNRIRSLLQVPIVPDDGLSKPQKYVSAMIRGPDLLIIKTDVALLQYCRAFFCCRKLLL